MFARACSLVVNMNSVCFIRIAWEVASFGKPFACFVFSSHPPKQGGAGHTKALRVLRFFAADRADGGPLRREEVRWMKVIEEERRLLRPAL